MVWDAISWHGLEQLVMLGRITYDHYLGILCDHVHPFIHTIFPGEHLIFQDNKAPIHAAKHIQEWFEEHDNNLRHLGLTHSVTRL